jgi:NAD(P)-dependent dehydrogenase (short-subunit alcohol dehydrogenase family)
MAPENVVLITNATHFVGPTASRVLMDDGLTVICHDQVFSDPAKREAFRGGREGPSLIAGEDPKEVAEAAAAVHGKLDAVICNDAFPAIRAPVDEATQEDMRAGLEALVTWPFALVGGVVPHLKKNGGGRIVMVTSAAPIRGLSNYSMYATARGATNAMTRSLALELARSNIQVNAVAPNYIENPDYFPPELLANQEAMGKMLKNIPLNRLGKPEEVAALISFLVSGKCNFITGHVIPISGGWA